MKKNYVSNSSESPRMFKNELLEKVSKVHFIVPVIIYVPVISFFIYQFFTQVNATCLSFVAFFALGILLWSITEYFIHRFIFHFKPRSAWGQRIHFIFHGVHHDYPKDAKRLVMPPSVSIPLALIFYFFYRLFIPIPVFYALFSGLVSGYLLYDMLHYAIHHYNHKSKFWKKLQRHHATHHYADATRGYGVSSALWDKIFKTDFEPKNHSEKRTKLNREDLFSY